MNTIEQLEKSMAEAKLNLIKMESQLAELKAQEWPKDGGKYWASDTNTREVFESMGANASVDKYRIATGNVHRTEEEAEAYRDWLTNPRTQARRRVEMCDGFDPMGVRYIGHDDGRVFHTNWECKYGGISFTTEEQAQACIDLLGEDVIKLALGVES